MLHALDDRFTDRDSIALSKTRNMPILTAGVQYSLY
jgi:hypothetical protein